MSRGTGTLWMVDHATETDVWFTGINKTRFTRMTYTCPQQWAIRNFCFVGSFGIERMDNGF